jgi:formylglycine-generating enzyme required for sulfatase activity
MSKLLRFLVLVCVVQAAGAQGLFKGFIPDENGTNLDAPQAGKESPNLAALAAVKDCADCPEMVVIPAGSFVMGSEKYSSERPTHLVRIQSFLMSKTEVTQEQWFVVMGNNPSYRQGRTLPVEQVSWDDIQQFVTKFNQKTGKKYRLPSEAEWEYAARAGITTEWNFGREESELGNYLWYNKNSWLRTQEVGQKLPNAFGLFDMYGNVWEWVQDCCHENYIGAPSDGSAWTTGCADNRRVRRGGYWGNSIGGLSSARNMLNPDNRSNGVGFRLARDL